VRAIKQRDKGCVWPGCTQTHHLHIHHIQHWADGGSTSVDNGASLCSHHHTLVHEGGYSIQRVDNNAERLQEQFIQQQHINDQSQFDFEKELRNNRASFNTVRSLTPERYRFRVMNAQGQDIRGDSINDINGEKESSFAPKDHPDEWTRGHCSEPLPATYYGKQNAANAAIFSCETPASYASAS